VRRSIVSFVVVLLAVGLTTAALGQAYRGGGRIQGVVSDPAGKPIAGAKVTLFSVKTQSGPPPATTDKNGKWAVLGLTGGKWNIDVEAEGFQTSKGSVEISELQRIPPVKTALEPVVVVPAEEVPVAKPGLPQEAIDAVNAAQSLVDEAEGRTLSLEPLTEERKKQLYAGAVTNLESALALIPDDAENARTRTQIRQLLAQSYYKTGEVAKSVETLKSVAAADPSNIGVQMLLANLLLEEGRLEEGRAALAAVPESAMTDPTAYINVGILFMNKGQLQDAYGYFEKAVALNPERGETYYYRGLSLLQQQKLKEAKADLEKVVALAPESSEAGDAKELLKQFK
jgi:Flp pilus assembly protein TadD